MKCSGKRRRAERIIHTFSVFPLLVVLLFLVLLPGCFEEFGPVRLTTVDGKDYHGRITIWSEEAGEITLETGLGEHSSEKITEHVFAFDHVQSVTRISDEDYLREMRPLMQVEEGD